MVGRHNELQEDIDNATAWLTADGGVIKALKNSNDQWTDLLCCSASATASTGNVLRLNVNGIGFSSTGWNGPFTQAWTLDGRLVIGGTSVPSITVYDNQNNIIFQASANAMIWNATNSSMSSSGVITAVGASLTNATITGGTLKTINTSNNSYIQLGNGQLTYGVGAYEKGNIECTASGGLYIYPKGDCTINTPENFKLFSGGAGVYGLGADMTMWANTLLYVGSNGDINIESKRDMSLLADYGYDMTIECAGQGDLTIRNSDGDIKLACDDLTMNGHSGRSTTITIGGTNYTFENGILI
jgi:hypothetical protein